MKKLISLIAAVLMIACMAGCGANQSGSADSTEPDKELTFEETIAMMNDGTYSIPEIDVYADNRSPAERDKNALWDKNIFYAVEGITSSDYYSKKYDCNIEKRLYINAETRNRMEYDVYINPDTGKPNKIVSMEYLDEGLEITEYYYTNGGVPNFVYQYNTDNYITTFATLDKDGKRFQFSNDFLVNWRDVTGGFIRNITAGDKSAAAMSVGENISTIVYDEASDSQKKDFDRLERRMLNAAYNTYEMVMSEKGAVIIEGNVLDQHDTGISDADVEVYSDEFKTLIYKGKTASDGSYVIYVPNILKTYYIKFIKDGMSTCCIYEIEAGNNILDLNQDNIYLFNAEGSYADIELILGDALNYSPDGYGMESLDNAKVLVREGLNNRNGDVIKSVQSDSRGMIYLNLASGVYTLEISRDGYEVLYYTVVANPSKRNYYEIYATPTLSSNEIRIVLTWGEYPEDLDSHLFTENGTSSANTHVWYSEQSDKYDTFLDVDDTTSYGPETITIRNFDRNKYYKYGVVDYTNSSNGYYDSYALSKSNAHVNVYTSDGLAASYSVPTSKSGIIWEVFEIRNGKITPIQRYYNNAEDDSWWSRSDSYSFDTSYNGSSDYGSSSYTYSPGSSISSYAGEYGINSTEPFYGIWCAAERNPQDLMAMADDLYYNGFYPVITVSDEWSNLNSDRYYVLSSGIYYEAQYAEEALDTIKNEFAGDAYIKYTGNNIYR